MATPYLLEAAINYLIRVSSTTDPSISDLSDHYFKIILQPDIDIYPNPSTTHVTLKFNEKDNENYTLNLFNRYNMRIMTRKVNASYLKQVRINTFDLPNGIYFLKIVSAKGIVSKKIICTALTIEYFFKSINRDPAFSGLCFYWAIRRN